MSLQNLRRCNITQNTVIIQNYPLGGSQLKDYYGFTKSTQKLTPEMLKYAQKHYIKDGNWDNNMTEFFRSIKNYDQAANWLSKESSMFALPLLMQKKND